MNGTTHKITQNSTGAIKSSRRASKTSPVTAKTRSIAALLLILSLLIAIAACSAPGRGVPQEENTSGALIPAETAQPSSRQEPAKSDPPAADGTDEDTGNTEAPDETPGRTTAPEESPVKSGDPSIGANETAAVRSIYTDMNGDKAYIPADFKVSGKQDEQTIRTGLVVIGPDGSEYVWIPTDVTPLAVREFGSYFSGGSIKDYHDETGLDSYRKMTASVDKYGGFYLGRYEASKGENGLPASRRITASEPGQIWVQFSPQDTTVACQNLYAGNDTVQGFFPWGINWDTALQWLIDSGCKTEAQVNRDSTGWGNYSDDSFSQGARGNYTGAWEEAKSNNIYDLAGNNWEWTQERCGSNYVMRGGGYNLMGGACPGSRYPAALRDPLPGNDHHPNVCFRIGLYVE